MGLRDIGATLPPGFRFYPSDEELVCHYLYKKITNEEVLKGTLVEIDLHTCEPWQLPGRCKGPVAYCLSVRLQESNKKPMPALQLFNATEDWVLCRVFHKSKAEESTKFMFESTINSGSTVNLTESPLNPDHQTLPCGYQQMTSLSSTPSHQDQTSLLNLLQLSQDRNADPMGTDTSSRAADEYGFLWDCMGLEENSLGDGVVASNLEDLRFEIDHNSMVFL
ncbi:hypothetical protein SADUNF_Sadunf02G0030800 [Salix dunnii]|uniref:NAC domain-containing protein n=2 Tax=Malpighiales TaxID=3646 RepID=A0A835N610_9ROSI|nr:hypothetical protein SADUNF_Sadunf02G0030800 [Salix dunnii]